MTPARAQRLASRAQSRRDDGRRRLGARHAWNRLVRAGDRGDPSATAAVWRALLRHPDDELWTVLSRWRDPDVLSEELCAAATAPGRDVAERAALTGLCMRHALAPRDAARRAGFFTLTGQLDQWRALDPDRSLVAAAYRAADLVTRDALWQRLRQAADNGDPGAVDAALQVWLCGPSDELWGALGQWREPEHLTEAVLAAATEPVRPSAMRAALGAFCARQGMAPADPADRVLFYVLTGQQGQRRAADPDGSLLASAYQAGSDSVRAELRRELADVGDIDMVRVVASRRGTTLSVDESGYLHDQLVRRRDWGRLWEVVQDLPLAEAATATRLFGDGWRPADDAGRRLFEHLAAATPDAIATARAALTGTRTIRIQAEGLARAGTISADGHQMALWLAGEGSSPGVVNVHMLPGGEVTELYELAGPHPCLTYSGEALVIADSPAPSVLGPSRLRHCRDGNARELTAGTARRVVALAPWFAEPGLADGFAMLTGDRLLLYDGTGEVSGTMPLSGQHAGRAWSLLASEPGGRLAAASDDGFLMVLAELGSRVPQPLVRDGILLPHAKGICFAAPGLVAASGAHSVALRPVEGTMASPETMGATVPVAGTRHPVAVAPRNEVAVLDRDGQVRYISAETCALLTEPRELSGQAGSLLFGTPDGRYQGLVQDSSVVIAWPKAGELAALAAKPQARWQPADLATVSRAATAEFCPGAMPLLRLMLTSLERRFGAEVAIGRSPLAAASDDIALSYGGPSGG
jgi:hypothetical protein